MPTSFGTDAAGGPGCIGDAPRWAAIVTLERKSVGHLVCAVTTIGYFCRAARACATIPIAIPCYRVVRTDGSLSGYRWRLQRTQAGIEHEAKG